MTDLIAIPRPIIKQVLETFEEVAQWESDGDSSHPASKAIELLRAALDQPQVEREPLPEIVERVLRSAGKTRRETHNPRIMANDCIKLANWIVANTHPQPKREPLTDEEIKMLIPDGDEWKYEVGFAEATEFARAIERAVLEVRNEIS